MHPLYRFLTSKETNPKFAGPIKWNFQKFLVDHEGRVIARYDPREDPLSKKVIKDIEGALKAAAEARKKKEKKDKA